MTTDVTSVTAVTWAWRSDQQWEKFSDAMCLKLENAYAGNKQKVKVDKERFVDLSLKVCIWFSKLLCLTVLVIRIEEEHEQSGL